MPFLIDTDIVIYHLKGVDEVTARFRHERDVPKAMSAITYGELIFGAEKSKHREKNLAATYRVAEVLPVLEVNRAVMDVFGQLKSRLQREGVPVADFDLIIAATALCHNLTLVSNNIRHFERIPDLLIENWAS